MLKRVILTYNDNTFDGMKAAVVAAGGPRGVRSEKKALNWLSSAYGELKCDIYCPSKNCHGKLRYCCLNTLNLNNAAACSYCETNMQYEAFLFCDRCAMLLCHTCSVEDVEKNNFGNESKEDDGSLSDLVPKNERELRKVKSDKMKVYYYDHREKPRGKIAKLFGYRHFEEGTFQAGILGKEWKENKNFKKRLREKILSRNSKSDDEEYT